MGAGMLNDCDVRGRTGSTITAFCSAATTPDRCGERLDAAGVDCAYGQLLFFQPFDGLTLFACRRRCGLATLRPKAGGASGSPQRPLVLLVFSPVGSFCFCSERAAVVERVFSGGQLAAVIQRSVQLYRAVPLAQWLRVVSSHDKDPARYHRGGEPRPGDLATVRI